MRFGSRWVEEGLERVRGVEEGRGNGQSCIRGRMRAWRLCGVWMMNGGLVSLEWVFFRCICEMLCASLHWGVCL